MRYDLIINGVTVIEDIETDRPYPNATQVIEGEFKGFLDDGWVPGPGDTPRLTFMGGDKWTVMIRWDRVETLGVRIKD